MDEPSTQKLEKTKNNIGKVVMNFSKNYPYSLYGYIIWPNPSLLYVLDFEHIN